MATRNLHYRAYLSIRYWPLWIALGIGKSIAFLPLGIQHRLGATLGLCSYYLLKSRRKIAQQNIQTCFPDLDTTEQEKLVKDTFRSNAIGLIEALRSWFRDPESLRRRTTLIGQEHLDKALAKNKGVILLGGHFSTLDLAGSLTTLYFKADVLQRDHSNPLFNTFMTRSRLRLYGSVLDKFDLRGMLRSLKKNHIVWYATDQDYGRKNTVFVNFFGHPCSTLISTMRIAKMSGASVLPFSHIRTPDGQYEITVHPALEDFPSSNIEADAQHLNHILEEHILIAPEQYLWMHRRFKTTPEYGGINIYGQSKDKRL